MHNVTIAEQNQGKIKDVQVIGYTTGDNDCLTKQDLEIAVHNLQANGKFQPEHDKNGPYKVELYIEDNRLVFHIQNQNGDYLPYLVLSLTPYRRIIKDYFMICNSYHSAIKEGRPSRVEAIDMGRKGIHNEGAELLIERLRNKISIDINTARSLFTLICVLHNGKTHRLR